MRDERLFLASLWAMERVLVHSGLPAIPRWWRDKLERYYLSHKRRFVVRKGRRVFASTCVAPRLAVAEMLFGGHTHVPGTPPLLYAFLSVKRKEAGQRLAGVEAILRILGVEFRPQMGDLRLSLPRLFSDFAVVTASQRTAIGDTIAWAWCDEIAKWRDEDTQANPAKQVISALAPALATLPDARMFLVSSPFSVNDYHAQQYNLGDTELQQVACGATWEINPTLTEGETRKLEPNEIDWLREYAAIPSDSIEDNWFGVAVDSMMCDEAMPEPQEGHRLYIAIDPAFDGKSSPDRFGYAVVLSQRAADADDGVRVSYVLDSGSWNPDRSPEALAKRVREEVCERWLPKLGPWRPASSNVATVYSDQYEGYSFSELARNQGLMIVVEPWTGGTGPTSKLAKLKGVRTAAQQGRVLVPAGNVELRRQLRSVRGVFPKSGMERVEFPRDASGHCDELSAALMALVVALAYQPSVAAAPSIDPGTPPAWRHDAVAASVRRQRQAWGQNQRAEMRRALGLR